MSDEYDLSDMPILEREEPTHQWGAGNEENEENIPPPTKNKKNAVQFDYKLNRILKTEDLTGNGFRCLSAGQASSGRFKGFRFVANYMIINQEYPDGLYPADILSEIFKKSIQATETGLNEANLKANHYIIRFHSNLLDTSVFLHLHSIDPDTPAIILHKFRTVDQSGEERGKDSLVTQEFAVDITAFDAPPPAAGNAKIPRKRKFPGRGRLYTQRLKKREFDHQFDDNAFLELYDQDNYCLFRALEALRQKHMMAARTFYTYVRNKQAQDADIETLMTTTKIENANSYDISECGSLIQAYYDQLHSGIFAIWVFGRYGQAKPFWKSEPKNGYKAVLCLVYDDVEQHYYAINSLKHPGRIFGERWKYCFACEMPFQNDTKHKRNCRDKCLGCLRVGLDRPCKQTMDSAQKCVCGEEFVSDECYKYHQVHKICKNYKRCGECKIRYKVRWGKPEEKGQPKTEIKHVCYERFCKKCLAMHGPRPCFIRPLDPKRKKDTRLVFYDFECTTDFQPNPEQLRFEHQVNMVCATVVCSRCIENGSWNKPLTKSCEICGRHRNFSWAPFHYSGTKMDVKKKTDDPLGEFVHWLLTNWLKKKNKKGKGKNANGQKRKTKGRRPKTSQFIDDCAIDENGDDDDDDDDDDDEDDISEASENVGTDREEDLEFLLSNETNDGDDEEMQTRRGKNYETIVYAHNGGRYDHMLVFGELIRRGGVMPDLTMLGHRLYEMRMRKWGQITPTIFRDSHLIIQAPLTQFPSTFDIENEEKHFFPYAFNTAENYNVKLPGLPPAEYYNPDGMLKKTQEKFYKWHNANKNIPFYLPDQLASYCFSDVKLLLNGVIKMRHLFKLETGMDITDSITASSACMKYFRTLLPSDYLALVPHQNYGQPQKQSSKARRYLRWLTESEGLNIQYVENGGEKKYRQYWLDGFVEQPNQEKNLAIEIMGCYWHSCPHCFPQLSEEDVMGTGERVGDIWDRNAAKAAAIREEMELRIVWEHEIDELMEKDSVFKAFYENCIDSSPINIRDAFFGGRTGPELLYATAQEPQIPKFFDGRPADMSLQFELYNRETKSRQTVGTEECLKKLCEREIKFFDYVSLYPNEMFNQFFPVKHPKIHTLNKEVRWERVEDMEPKDSLDADAIHFDNSITKMLISPPFHTAFPVIPARYDDRLLFSLCRCCSKKWKKGKRDPNYECKHTEAQRDFVTTINSMELRKALKDGYIVKKLFHAYTWNPADMDDKLFREYIQKFLRLKYISSGWPAEIDNLPMSAKKIKKMRKFCAYASKELGIEFEPKDVQTNSGLKFIAKLLLNCLWGRFALRCRLSQTKIVTSLAELALYLNDERIEFQLVEQISPNAIMLVYKTKDEWIRENPSANLILALWTTASGRVRLLEAIQQLLKRPDVRIIYLDTDSIAFEYCKILGNPLEGRGLHLGQLSDVYPNHRILEVVCAGPKAYSVMLENLLTGEISFEPKVKGITLDMVNSKRYNHAELKRRVLNKIAGVEDKPLELHQTLFKSNRKGQIFTIDREKKFEVTLNKGVLNAQGQMLPFGFKSSIANIWDAKFDQYYNQSEIMKERRWDLFYQHRFTYDPSKPLNHFHLTNYERIIEEIFGKHTN